MPTINKPKKKQKNLSINEQVRKEIYSTSKWRKLREAKLIQNPLCEICLQNNIVTVGCDVHHIVSFVSAVDYLRRLELAYNFDNLQTLCKVCHTKIHNS